MSEQFNYSSVLAPYMKHLLNKKESAGMNTRQLKWILKEFDDFANAEKLTEPRITDSFIKKWRGRRINDCERTIYMKYSAWNQLTSLMCNSGCSCFVPHLPRRPKSDFIPYIFTEEQIATILKAADNYRLPRVRKGTALFVMPTLLRLLYSTGLRISEALSIRNDDLHLDECFIHIHKTKNGHERIVPLSESMLKVLEVYIAHRNSMPIKGVDNGNALLFTKSDGTEIRAASVYGHLRILLDKCGIPYNGNHHGPRIHDLRHTYAVHSLVQMGRNGMDLYTGLPILSTSLGHRSLYATEQYVRLTCTMYPEMEVQCSEINSFVYPKNNLTNDNND